jgi:hypothetical protein
VIGIYLGFGICDLGFKYHGLRSAGTGSFMDPDQKIVYSMVKRFVEKTQKEKGRVSSLTEALGIEASEVISLVGAGGKTTLMFRLAKELSLTITIYEAVKFHGGEKKLCRIFIQKY